MSDPHTGVSHEKISPYIRNHGWSILADHSQLRVDLDARNFRPRSGAVVVGGMAQQDERQRPDPWQRIDDRDDVTFDRLQVTGLDKRQRKVSLRRMIVTTDAGIGKSVAVDWFLYRFNLPDANMLAFQLNAAQLEGNLREFQVSQDKLDAVLLNWMAGKIAQADESRRCSMGDAVSLVQRSRQNGRLVILIDGLDHVSTGLPNLLHVLGSVYWQKCRFILAGRPYALQTHFDELELDHGWQFIRLEEFTPDQQEEYLGPRYNAIPPQARPALANVLTIPRVLYYMKHHVSEQQFGLIRTAADVYWIAIRQMIKEAMNGSGPARKLGLLRTDTIPDQVSEMQLRYCRNLLAVLAYVMTLGLAERKRLSSGIAAPNFERLTEDRMELFEKEISKRYKSEAGQGLQQDMAALAAMNTFLNRGVFDSDVTGFKEIEFRNRSLQEFLTALYLCTKATPEDSNLWWDRLYLPHDAESDQFYNVWQFVSEMPGTKRPGIDSDGTGHGVPKAIVEEHWLEAIEPLYRTTFVVEESVSRKALAAGENSSQPSTSDPQITESSASPRDARRSCEMIFRTWPQLERLCEENDKRAREIRNRWLGEFESILAGQQGSEREAAARDLVDGFLLIPGGTFQMGSPPEKAAQMPEGERNFWTDWYARIPAGRVNWPSHLDEVLSQLGFGSGRAGEANRKEWSDFLTRIADEETIENFLQEMSRVRYPSDETPVNRDQTIETFLLARSPVVNRWWKLFVPQHGLGGEPADYSRISPTSDHPAISIDWFSAWSFALWLHWDGQSCRLPWENQWEYAVKFGTPWDWRYWWSDQWNDGKGKVTAERNWRTDSTTVPNLAHANPHTQVLDLAKGLGILDMLGNVQEWCHDQYRAAYKRHAKDEPGDASSSRCLRGGSFFNLPEFCRSANRYWSNPTLSNFFIGVRLSRAASD